MAIIKLRSPRYEVLLTPSGAVSAKLALSVGGTLRYEIVKECTADSNVEFEIAELVRDYLTITANNDYSQPSNQISISRVITFYDGANASGSVVSGGNTVTHTGLDGYGTFKDGVNPEIASSQVYLFTPDYSTNPDTYKIYAPIGEEGAFPYLDTNGDVQSNEFDSAETTFTVRSKTLTIERLDCTKYDATKVLFLNKWGAIQELWFRTKKVESISTKKSQFQRNLMSFATNNTASYDDDAHSIETFNKNGKLVYKLSSGYYPEWTNAWFEELLLSEYVWIYQKNYALSQKIFPVNVKTSSMTKKTSLNDKLIEYTIEFEQANDYINNIR